jgi:DNA repair protein RadC
MTTTEDRPAWSGFQKLSNHFLVSVVLVSTTSCMRTVNMGDPALKPFASMYSVDRSQLRLYAHTKDRPCLY